MLCSTSSKRLECLGNSISSVFRV